MARQQTVERLAGELATALAVALLLRAGDQRQGAECRAEIAGKLAEQFIELCGLGLQALDQLGEPLAGLRAEDDFLGKPGNFAPAFLIKLVSPLHDRSISPCLSVSPSLDKFDLSAPEIRERGLDQVTTLKVLTEANDNPTGVVERAGQGLDLVLARAEFADDFPEPLPHPDQVSLARVADPLLQNKEVLRAGKLVPKISQFPEMTDVDLVLHDRLVVVILALEPDAISLSPEGGH